MYGEVMALVSREAKRRGGADTAEGDCEVGPYDTVVTRACDML